MTQIGFDAFARPDQAGWGTASDGQVWSALLGGSGFAIASDEGICSGTTSRLVMALGTTTWGDMMLLVRSARATSTATATDLALRVLNGSHYYGVRLKSGNLDIFSYIAGTTTVLATMPYSVTLGSFDWIRAEVQGSTLYAKAWPDNGTNEPVWMLTATDSNITGSGRFGLAFTMASGDTVSFDNFYADNLVVPLPPVPLNPYGVTSFNPGTGIHTDVPLVISVCQDLGLCRVRFQQSWKNIETPVQGTFHWTTLDTAIQQFNNAGIHVTFPIQGAPTWAKQNPLQLCDGVHYLPDPTMMATFASLVATRYNGQPGSHGFIDAYEIGNEEFNGIDSGTYPIEPCRDPKWWIPCLRTVSPALRAASPTAQVGAAAIWWIEQPNINNWMVGISSTSGVAPLFDYWNFHFYPGGSDPMQNNPSFAQEWQAMQSIMTAYGVIKPVKVTEFGWAINTNPGRNPNTVVSQAQQAQYYQELLTSAEQSEVVTEVDFYTITNNNDGMSLVQGTSAPFVQTLAYGVFKNFIRLFPQWPTRIASVRAPLRSGAIDATLRTGSVEAAVRLGTLDGTQRSGQFDAGIRSGQVPAARLRGGS